METVGAGGAEIDAAGPLHSTTGVVQRAPGPRHFCCKVKVAVMLG